ncbi:DMT family transporter [Spirulina sp. CS-785/01]|uniref:DMT family transporter n=1 Tax=Spirulina sp. CS-785/01 TaxID=3021716 RepID=UPI00232E4525|nr:DMT family transporter [Spirulina sp. CS-785/01]MDB9311602.1 DMT family transporter [Spirulina sp. CS-785/01]
MQYLNNPTVYRAIAFVLLWNSGFIGAEYGLPYMGTFTLLFVRYAILSLCLLGYLMVKQEWVLPDQKTLAHTALVGILAHGVWLSCALLALEANVPAGIVALVVALQPLATGAFSGLVVGERASLVQWCGLVVGFLGIAIAIGTRLQLNNDISPFAYFIPFGSVIAITIASLLQRRRETRSQKTMSLPVTVTLFYQSLATTLALAIPAVMIEQLQTQWTVPLVTTLSWLIFGVSLGAYSLMWQLLSRLDATRVASLFYFGPPVTMVMAWIAFGDIPQLADIVGLFVVVIGVLLVQLSRKRLG